MNSSNPRRPSSRRSFLKRAAVSTACLASVSPTAGFASPVNRPRIGVIGCGSRWGWQLANGGTYGVGIHFAQFADYVAVCDVDRDRVAAAAGLVKQWNGSEPEQSHDYRSIIDRDDIDAVLIFTPDHWHAKIAIEAMLSGKDVYCEKPMTLTIEEGQEICRVCRETGRVFQVGTQQRSVRHFRTAIALVRAGRLGTIQRVECGIGGAPTSPQLPVANIPATLDWDRWLGPAPKTDYRFLAGANNETKAWSRSHYEFRWWYDYSGGKLTDWGAHHVDIATWALGKTDTGPSSVIPIEVEHPVGFQDGDPIVEDQYNTATKFLFKIGYQDNTELYINSDARNGILFEGTEGRLFVNRGGVSGAPFEALGSQPLDEETTRHFYAGLTDSQNTDEATSMSLAHVRNFFACLVSRALPNSDVFSHHRALTTCHLAGIAGRLGRALKWDPDNETIMDDSKAQSMLGRTKRAGFEIEN